MRIATWNVNSVRQRLGHLLDFLGEAEPDALCLQEIKCVDADFPRAEIEAAGWQVETHGQKTFNGVAIISRARLEDVRRGLPGDDGDEQARYLEGVLPLGDGVVRVASIYLPNGNPPNTEKYPYKLGWMQRMGCIFWSSVCMALSTAMGPTYFQVLVARSNSRVTSASAPPRESAIRQRS